MALETATQTDRSSILYLDGAENADLLFYKLEGREGISELYEWRIQALSATDTTTVDPNHWIGMKCHVQAIYDADENERYFCGVCTDLRWLGKLNNRNHYELTVRPHLWMMTRRVNSRIFANQTLSQILSTVFQNVTGLRHTCDGSVPSDTIPYCVQYQETNFAFVSRLLEKYGLHYYFEHGSSGEDLKIGGPAMARIDHGEAGSLPYLPPGEVVRDKMFFDSVAIQQSLRSDKSVINDYDYSAATRALDATITDSPGHSSTGNELYEYPYGYDAAASGSNLAQIKLDAERAEATLVRVAGNAMILGSGSKMKIPNNPLPAPETPESEYMVVRATHRLVGDLFRTITGKAEEIRYRGSWEAVPIGTAYRVPRRTPWPRMAGPQTAKVVDTNLGVDDEIEVDDQGRILVRFHWEREEKASCRVRVAQPWAGNSWGTSFIPRTGMEVVVDFVDGDPDRPLVTGAVYNSANVYPIAPDNKTRSGIRSNSSQGGEGWNFLAFDDKKDEEEIYLHAEKDRKTDVEHDDILTVGNNQTQTVTGNRTREVTGGDEIIDIKGESTEDKFGTGTGGTGNRTVTIHKGNDTLTISEGNRSATISQGNDELTVSQGNRTTTISQGDLTVSVDAGTVSITAGTKIELTVGGSTLTIDSSSITLSSTDIELNAQASVKANGMNAEVNGSTNTKITGGTVNIN